MKGLKPLNFGALSVITTLLIFSAGFRVLGTSGIAFALDNNESANGAPPEVAEVGDKDKDLDTLLASFQSREKALIENEERIERRSKELRDAEVLVAERIKNLQTAEARLRELLAIADEAAEDDVAKLTNVYQNMKPKAAAVIFEQMPPAFAAGFLARMNPEAAASVLASLTPQSAYAISVVFAGRNAESSKN